MVPQIHIHIKMDILGVRFIATERYSTSCLMDFKHISVVTIYLGFY